MTLVLCILSFVLGLIAIDMFCDHYVLVARSLTPSQIETCTSFNRNVSEQPWYMALIVTLPSIIALVVMFKRAKRSIYDRISFVLFLVVVGIFVMRVNPIRTALLDTKKGDESLRAQYLQQLAYSHTAIAGLLFVLIIFQLLAEKREKQSLKNKNA